MHTRDYPVVEAPDFLLAALERANDAVVIVDSDLRVSHFNAAAELIWDRIAQPCSVAMSAIWGSGTCNSMPAQRWHQVG